MTRGPLPGPHAAQTGDAGSLQRAHEHGLSPVVGGVAHRDPVGTTLAGQAFQEAVARAARRCLRAARVGRILPGRNADSQRDSQTARRRTCMADVPVDSTARTQSVVEVRGDHLDPQRHAQPAQQRQQGRRIRAGGVPGNHRLAAPHTERAQSALDLSLDRRS